METYIQPLLPIGEGTESIGPIQAVGAIIPFSYDRACTPLTLTGKVFLSSWDADNNGSLDLFVGGKDGLIRAYANLTTSPTGPPVFRQVDDEVLRLAEYDPVSGASLNRDASNEAILIPGGVAPALGDLNGDGIVDLVIGNNLGEMIYYKGVAEIDPGDFFNESQFYNRLFDPNETFYFVSGVGNGLVIPTLVDYDLDGDLDIIAGRSDGYLRAWESQLAQNDSEDNGLVWPVNLFPDPELDFPLFPIFRFPNPLGLVYRQIQDSTFASIYLGSRAAVSLGNLYGSEEPDMVGGNEEGTLQFF